MSFVTCYFNVNFSFLPPHFQEVTIFVILFYYPSGDELGKNSQPYLIALPCLIVGGVGQIQSFGKKHPCFNQLA